MFHRFRGRHHDGFSARFHRHGSHDGGERHRHRRGGRGSRFFESGDLRLVLLHLIAARPRHGYELMEEIEQRLGGTYRPSPGTIYPTLTLLEELGQIAVQATEGARKLFGITDEGRRVLEAQKPEVDRLVARMDAAVGEGGSQGAASVLRAVHNLKFALRLRLGRGDLTEDQLRTIVDAIDGAATAVERS